MALAGLELELGTGTTLAPTPPVPSDAHFLAPAFVWDLVRELAADAFFGPIVREAAATLGLPVDRHGVALLEASRLPHGGVFLVQCRLLYRRGQGSTDRLCIPASGELRTQVLHECHDGPLGAHFGRAKTGSLVRRLAFWFFGVYFVYPGGLVLQDHQRTQVTQSDPEQETDTQLEEAVHRKNAKIDALNIKPG